MAAVDIVPMYSAGLKYAKYNAQNVENDDKREMQCINYSKMC